jgi:dynein heavy chain
MKLPDDEELKEKLVEVCVDMQERIKALSERFEKELRWHYYVTPTSYLELLKTFKLTLQKKEDDINSNIQRYTSGVQKILSTEKEVSNMKAVLEDLQPKLERSTVENSHMLINL